MTRVVGYCRVSTEEQGLGDSLAAQEARIRAHCLAAGLDLVGVEVDTGLSASTLDRDGLYRARDTIARGDASGLVVVKLDRLTRSVRDLIALRDGGMGEIWRLISLAEAVDTSTATGRMFLTLIVTLAEWERETTGERTRDLLRHAKAQGQHLGAVPYGWRRVAVARDANGRRVGDRGRLVPDEEQQAWIAEMRHWHSAGYSLSSIAAGLNMQGVKGAMGGQWTATSVRRALKAQPTSSNDTVTNSSLTACPPPAR